MPRNLREIVDRNPELMKKVLRNPTIAEKFLRFVDGFLYLSDGHPEEINISGPLGVADPFDVGFQIRTKN